MAVKKFNLAVKKTNKRVFFLQKVVGSSSGNVRFALSGSGIKLQKDVFQVLVYFHNSGLVAASVAVVGRTENGHDISVMRPVVALRESVKYVQL